jgi:hypothetical protein
LFDPLLLPPSSYSETEDSHQREKDIIINFTADAEVVLLI